VALHLLLKKVSQVSRPVLTLSAAPFLKPFEHNNRGFVTYHLISVTFMLLQCSIYAASASDAEQLLQHRRTSS
jgi:hypothetical protein